MTFQENDVEDIQEMDVMNGNVNDSQEMDVTLEAKDEMITKNDVICEDDSEYYVSSDTV